MNIVYTLTSYPPATGGAQIHQHKLAQLIQKHHHIQVVTHWNSYRNDWLLGTTLRAPSKSCNYSIDDIQVHRVGLSWREKARIAPFVPLYYPAMGLALPPIAQQLEGHLAPYMVDADLIHNVRIGREGLSYASLGVARRYDIPFVLTPVHHPRWVGWPYHAYLKLYTLADRVLALTEPEKQTLISFGVQEERISVVGQGPILARDASPVRFREMYRIAGPMVLFLGQHYPYKGYQQLVEAAKLVWQRVPEVAFVFIGPAVGRSEAVFAMHADRRIHRLGQVDLQTKTDALAACTLLCVPSMQESFGGVYTEAWSFGKPVIGCPIPAVADVINDGVNGYLVQQQTGEIAERICDLLLNPGQAAILGQAGQQKVERQYSWPRLVERVEQAYRLALH